jgi:hypothetical protein
VTAVVHQELDIPAINSQLHGQGGRVVRDMLRRGLRVQTVARKKAPADSGRLRGSISLGTEAREVQGTSTFAIVVGSDVKYAIWVHNGTGLWGPRRK